MKYPDCKLVQRAEGVSWYFKCTIPSELRPLFKGRKQFRATIGTSDRRLAE